MPSQGMGQFVIVPPVSQRNNILLLRFLGQDNKQSGIPFVYHSWATPNLLVSNCYETNQNQRDSFLSVCV